MGISIAAETVRKYLDQINPLWDHTLPTDFSRTLDVDSQVGWIWFRHAEWLVSPATSHSLQRGLPTAGWLCTIRICYSKQKTRNHTTNFKSPLELLHA